MLVSSDFWLPLSDLLLLISWFPVAEDFDPDAEVEKDNDGLNL